jgi:hypothetical protein
MKTISLSGHQNLNYFSETRIFKDLNCEFIIKMLDNFWFGHSHSPLGNTGFLITEYCQVIVFIFKLNF